MNGLVEGEDGGWVYGEAMSVWDWGRARDRTFVLTSYLRCKLDEFQRVELVLDWTNEAEDRGVSSSLLRRFNIDLLVIQTDQILCIRWL